MKNNKHSKELDPFRWLESESPRTSAWIQKEEKITSNYLSGIPERDVLKKKFEKLFHVDSMRMPIRAGEYIFYRYRKAHEEEASLYVKKGLSGKPSLLLNPAHLPKKDRAIISSWTVSKDASLIAFDFSKAGNDKSEIRIFDVKSKKFLRDRISSAHYPYFNCWNKDATGFWYRKSTGTNKADEKYFNKVYFHTIGQPESKDTLFFDIGSERVDMPTLDHFQNWRYLTVTVFKGNDRTEAYLFDTENPSRSFVELTKNMEARSYPVVQGDFVYLITDHNAPNKKVLRRKIYMDYLGKWETYIKESKYVLESCSSVSGYLILHYFVNICSKVFIVNLKNNKKEELLLPGLGIVSSIATDFESKEVFLYFSSLNIAPAYYKVDIVKRRFKVYWKPKIFSDIDSMSLKQEWYRSKDGTRIPMFILYKKGLKRNGTNPTLVYAYGGFGASITPDFDYSIIPFVENGGVYCMANIRGGGEFGENWHDKYRHKNRYKIYEDFASALKYLTKREYTNPNKIAIWGGSNGGLLASITMLKYPTLFKAALVAVPVTDMLRYHLFNGGRWWIHDYGDPDNISMRKYLLKWSPYHLPKKKNYPTAMVITSDQDDRVHPLHSYKLVASLKSNKLQKNNIFLRVERKAGHSGASKVTPYIEKMSDMFAFLYKELGI